MANETPRNQLTGLQKKIADTSFADKILRVVATDLWARINQRVFFMGKLSSGASPGPYSTKPMYASTLISSKISAKGKNGKSKFISGKKKGETKKSRYLQHGYMELKVLLGKPSRFDFSGQLKGAFTFSKETANSYVHGFVGVTRRKIANEKKVATNADIVEGLEDKYGEIFGLSEPENKRIDEILNREIDIYLQGI